MAFGISSGSGRRSGIVALQCRFCLDVKQKQNELEWSGWVVERKREKKKRKKKRREKKKN